VLNVDARILVTLEQFAITKLLSEIEQLKEI
jgi:hypothetical protein